jgi:hypothetical protein
MAHLSRSSPKTQIRERGRPTRGIAAHRDILSAKSLERRPDSISTGDRKCPLTGCFLQAKARTANRNRPGQQLAGHGGATRSGAPQIRKLFRRPPCASIEGATAPHHDVRRYTDRSRAGKEIPNGNAKFSKIPNSSSLGSGATCGAVASWRRRRDAPRLGCLPQPQRAAFGETPDGIYTDVHIWSKAARSRQFRAPVGAHKSDSFTY